MSWPPISPSSFYNLPSGPPTSLCQLPMASGPHSPSLFIAPQINPSLMTALPPVGQSAPATPAAPSVDIQPHLIPPQSLSPMSPSTKSMRNSQGMTLTNFSMQSSQSIPSWRLVPRSWTNGRRSQNLSKQRVHVLGAIMRH